MRKSVALTISILGALWAVGALTLNRLGIWESLWTIPRAFVGQGLTWVFVAAAFAYAAYRAVYHIYDARAVWWPTFWLSLIFSAALTLGEALLFDFAGQFAGTIRSPARVLASIYVFIGFFWLFYLLIGTAFAWTHQRSQITESLRDSTTSEQSLRFSTIFERKPWLVYLFAFLGLIISYGFWWVMMFPAVLSPDSNMQINQALGLTSPTNHHPFMHTLMIAGVLRPLTSITTVFNATAAFTLIQLIVASAVTVFVLWRLRAWGFSPVARGGVYLWFLLYPVYGIYAVTIWKDIPFGYAFLLYLVLIVDLLRAPDRMFAQKWWWVLFVLASMGTTVLRRNGVFAAVAGAIILIILLRRYRWKVVIATLAPILLMISIDFGVQSYFDVAPGPTREALAVPLQQIARAAHERGGEFTDEQRSFTEELFPDLTVAELGELYEWSEPLTVTRRASPEFLDTRRTELVSGWLDIGLSFPREYVTSFLAGSVGWWYPDNTRWVVWTGISQFMAIEGMETPSGAFVSAEPGTPWEAGVRALVVNPRPIPVWGQAWSIGLWIWMAATTLVGGAVRGRKPIVAGLIAPIGILWLTTVAAPAYSEFRLLYGLVLAVPVLLLLAFANWKEPDYSQAGNISVDEVVTQLV